MSSAAIPTFVDEDAEYRTRAFWARQIVDAPLGLFQKEGLLTFCIGIPIIGVICLSGLLIPETVGNAVIESHARREDELREWRRRRFRRADQ